MPAVDAGKPDSSLVPAFEIRVGGSPLADDIVASVRAVTVDDQISLPGMFTVELGGSEAQPGAPGWLSDPNLFALGATVVIKLGYLGVKLEPVMVGEITSLEPEFKHNAAAALTVRGYDRRDRMQRVPKTRTFLQVKDSDIASSMAGEAHLSATVQDSGAVHEYLIQVEQTDLEFLRQRARRINFEVLVDDATLIFRPAARPGPQVPTLTLGDELLELFPRLSTAGQVSGVSVLTWSPKDKKVFKSTAGPGDEPGTMGGASSGAQIIQKAFGATVATLSSYPAADQAEADSLAQAHFNETEMELIRGDGACWGRPDLRAGSTVALDGLGDRFNGQYYLTSVVHRYSPSEGYRTTFSVNRNAS